MKLFWVGAVLALSACGAHGEFVASLFGGMSLTENNDLGLRQSGGTDLTFHNVSYEGRSFESPLYYGGRLVYFPEQILHWGFGLEFFRAKAYLNVSDSVHVTGLRNGMPVDAQEQISDSIESFNLSHGLNFLTADVMYRWFLGERGKDFLGRLQPYAGLGIGAVIPHVESSVGGVHFGEYQWHGPGVQWFLGTNFDLTRHWSVFLEYKLSYADLDLNIPGGTISLTPWTHHFVTGLSFRF